MIITFYFRDPREGNYSIEQIFNTLAEQLKSNCEIRYFYVESSSNKLKNIIKARKLQGDINHITGDVNWLAYGLDPKKTIITVHDLGHFEHTLKGLKRWLFKKIWLEGPLRICAKVTTISSFSKQRLLFHFPALANKTEVIYNPLALIYKRPIALKIFNKECPHILQVGQMSNKNVERLIEAVEEIPCKLLFLRKQEEKLINKLNTLKINYEFYSDLKEDEVVNLYRKADILYFASTYEGFGMPIIEAQSQGCVVVTSNITAMPEVAGEGAYFVDPFDIDAINTGLCKIIKDDHYRNELVVKGLQNINRFNLQKVMKSYLNTYQDVAND
jgi:glycosyltransferase involved in cell wall biosynthesis